MMDTDLVIVGCGAGGLLAAVTAGELGVRCVAVERRHRVGLKLLMCGNNRCNISHAFNAEQMLEAYGEPVATFLRTAMTQFAPQTLSKWFARNGLATCVKNNRIYPTTEKGDDVLHCFTDRMRDLSVPLMLNSPVERLEPVEGGYRVVCEKLSLTAKTVLLATGGVSYPKTGSVGDGQRMLAELEIDVTPLRAGLAGIDVKDAWLQTQGKFEFQNVKATVSDGQKIIGVTMGNMLCENGCLRGTAIFDATRLIARHQLKSFGITLDLCPQMGAAAVESTISRGGLAALGIPEQLEGGLKRILPNAGVGSWLKAVPLSIEAIRPLKEAIVTVGGVALDEVDPQTMEVRKLPGVYVCGELLDVDGPTGGFNLHAAFATAHLAVKAIAESLGIAGKPKDAAQAKANDAKKEAYRDKGKGGRGGVHGGKTPPSEGGRWEKSAPSSEWKPKNSGGKHQGGADNNGRQPTNRPRSRADSKPGNRWDNSEFERRRTRP